MTDKTSTPETPNELTLEFHRTYGQPIRTEPVYDTPELVMRANLIMEEALELEQALEDESLVDVSDALGDIVYVCYGAAHTHGLQLDVPFGLESGQTPARALLKSLLNEGKSPQAHPHLNHEDLTKAISSIKHAAEEYLQYVTETPAEDGDISVIYKYLVFIVSGSYYTSFISGIPLDAILQEIQKSNLSKLGDDGNPIYREDGKVLKGPNFFIPEPNIAAVLLSAGATFTSDADREVIGADTDDDNESGASFYEIVSGSLTEEEDREEEGTNGSDDGLFTEETVETPATETFSSEELSNGSSSNGEPETGEDLEELEELVVVSLEDPAVAESEPDEEDFAVTEEFSLDEIAEAQRVAEQAAEDEEALEAEVTVSSEEKNLIAEVIMEETSSAQEESEEIDSSLNEPEGGITPTGEADEAETAENILDEQEAVTDEETAEEAENTETVEILPDAQGIIAEEHITEQTQEAVEEESEPAESPDEVIPETEDSGTETAEDSAGTNKFDESEPDFDSLFRKK